MVAIFGNWGRIRTWINKRIRIKSPGNLFTGEHSGENTTGQYNNFVGYKAGYSNIGGDYNNFMGANAGRLNITGCDNNFMGYGAGYSNIGGIRNNFMGYQAGYSNTNGNYNSFVGYQTGYSNTTGLYNNFMGYQAGYTNTNGNYNNFVGYKAGLFETGSYKLFIDTVARANEADARVKALIYGIFAAATADQLLRINAVLELTVINEYANNAAAITAGLTAGQLYRSADYLKIVH